MPFKASQTYAGENSPFFSLLKLQNALIPAVSFYIQSVHAREPALDT